MGVFTYVCRKNGEEWSGKQIAGGDLEATASTTYDLQRKLVQTSLSVDSSGGIQSSFSLVTPTSAVFQVIVGGGCFIAASAPSGGSGAAAAEAPAAAAEEKKEEKEESDDDMGFSLFD